MFYTRNLVFYLPLNEFVSQIFMFCFHHKMPLLVSLRGEICVSVFVYLSGDIIWGHYFIVKLHVKRQT